MKKLFALFLVVAMLSVAGTAMATVTVSPDKVSVAAGSTATVVVTVAPGDGYVVVGTPTASVSWVTFTSSSDSGYTFTAAPTASVGAGDYTVTFTATESLDVTGHSASVVTETGTATITVTNAAPTPIPYNPPTTGRTVENVKVISVTVATIATRVQTFTTVVVTRVTTLFNTASTKTAVATALSNLLGGAVPVSATVQNPDNTRTYLSSNYTAGDNAGNLEKAAAKLKQASGNDNKRAIGVIEPFTVEAAGFQPMALAVDKTFAGQKIGMNMGAYRLTSTSSVSAAATAGGNEVVFFTSDGASTDVVPDSGDLTAIAYVEPGVAYEPIPYVDLTGVSAADIASLDNAAGTTSKDVTVADESVDAGIQALIARGFVTEDTLGVYRLSLLAFKNGEAPAQVQSGTVYTWDIGLNFP
ncbi:MAG: hypothetical protein IJR35_02965, partial [Synergistaceae bacterium]|nr:hypothetical protein [Synergistaceae bacterium]